MYNLTYLVKKKVPTHMIALKKKKKNGKKR